jgi:lysyl-tRNA synthetase, class II
MNEIPLNSSVLAGLRYDPDHQQLWLRFQTQELYLYRMVPATVVQALIQAPSQGRYFNSAIRGRFEFHLLS